MTNIALDERLQRDCYIMGKWHNNLLLLMDNALLPWLILVPESQETEFYHLPQLQQQDILNKINQLSKILIEDFGAKKLNIATIGNIVSQLHIHVIGRSSEDHCWPSVVWGNSERTPYTQEQLLQISSRLQSLITDQYSPYQIEIKTLTNDQ